MLSSNKMLLYFNVNGLSIWHQRKSFFFLHISSIIGLCIGADLYFSAGEGDQFFTEKKIVVSRRNENSAILLSSTV